MPGQPIQIMNELDSSVTYNSRQIRLGWQKEEVVNAIDDILRLDILL